MTARRLPKVGPNIDVRSPAPRSVVGLDAGLASFGCAHVERRDEFPGLDPPFRLLAGRVYFPPDTRDAATVAEENAWRATHLLRWLRPVLGQAVADGAEAFHAERYEQLRQASAAAKYAAGHAVLVVASALCEPRPRLQHAGYGGPAFASGREAKRAATGCDVATKAVVIAAARRLIGGMSDALRGLNAEQRPHLADAGIVALHALGHREQPILIGGEECAGGGKGTPIETSAAFAGGFEVWTKYGQKEKGVAEAEAAFAGRAVIFAGHRVAKAFDFDEEPLVWCEVRSAMLKGKPVNGDGFAYMAAVLPDLGGKWWNQPKNVARARVFLRAAGRMA